MFAWVLWAVPASDQTWGGCCGNPQCVANSDRSENPVLVVGIWSTYGAALWSWAPNLRGLSWLRIVNVRTELNCSWCPESQRTTWRVEWGRKTHTFGVRSAVSRNNRSCFPTALSQKGQGYRVTVLGSQSRTGNEEGSRVILAGCEHAGIPKPLMSQPFFEWLFLRNHYHSTEWYCPSCQMSWPCCGKMGGNSSPNLSVFSQEHSYLSKKLDFHYLWQCSGKEGSRKCANIWKQNLQG